MRKLALICLLLSLSGCVYYGDWDDYRPYHHGWYGGEYYGHHHHHDGYWRD